MLNLAMDRKIKKGEAIDLSKNKRDGAGNYILETFVEDVDYCDALNEVWIWSIGQHIETGQILASVSGRFYQNPAFKCLFLR